MDKCYRFGKGKENGRGKRKRKIKICKRVSNIVHQVCATASMHVCGIHWEQEFGVINLVATWQIVIIMHPGLYHFCSAHKATSLELLPVNISTSVQRLQVTVLKIIMI